MLTKAPEFLRNYVSQSLLSDAELVLRTSACRRETMKCLLSDHGALLHGGLGLFKAVILNRDLQESPGMRSCTLQPPAGQVQQ